MKIQKLKKNLFFFWCQFVLAPKGQPAWLSLGLFGALAELRASLLIIGHHVRRRRSVLLRARARKTFVPSVVTVSETSTCHRRGERRKQRQMRRSRMSLPPRRQQPSRRSGAQIRRQAPSPAPPTLPRARSAQPISGPSLDACDPAPLLFALGGAPSASLGAGCPRGRAAGCRRPGRQPRAPLHGGAAASHAAAPAFDSSTHPHEPLPSPPACMPFEACRMQSVAGALRPTQAAGGTGAVLC